MNPSLGVTIEALVAILLVLTIGYCMLLNARLKRLKADEHSLKATIAELITATEIAERAIGGLKHTVRDVNENLGSQLASAAQMSEHLKRQLAEGDHVVRRLTKIAIAARPSQVPEAEAREPAPRDFAARDFAPGDTTAKPSNAQALAAAAQAFSERRRTGGLAA
jgi:chromosome segregation ATPase